MTNKPTRTEVQQLINAADDAFCQMSMCIHVSPITAIYIFPLWIILSAARWALAKSLDIKALWE